MDVQDHFRTLWQAAQPMVRTYAFARTGDHVLAEELEQDTALTAWRAFDRYDTSRPFNAWVMGIARNLLRQHYRRGGSAPARLPLHDMPELAAAAVRTGDALHEQQKHLRVCIKQLAQAQRALLQQYYGEDEKIATIARRLTVSDGVIKTRLHRMRAMLRRCIETRIRNRKGTS